MSLNSRRLLIKNGFIIDGTGDKGYEGSLIINNNIIEDIIKGKWDNNEVNFDKIVDANNLIIAPGFIDIHSHLDWYQTDSDINYILPFLRQGITTIIGGNCGYSAAGIKRDSIYLDEINKNLFQHDLIAPTFSEYFDEIKKNRLKQNVVILAGHGTTRSSICGNSDKLIDGQLDEILNILNQAMDDGAAGVSFGLQYVPGQYSSVVEMEEIAKLVKSKDKIFTAHARAFSLLSGDYPLIPFGEPHNIIALKELLNIAEKTNVNLQISHLIFVGKSTHKTSNKALRLIDDALEKGINVNFDTYGHHCGVSSINVFLPPWFKSKGLDAYKDNKLIFKVKMMMNVIFKLLGFDYSNIQILDAGCEELSQYNGMFLPEIAEKRSMSNFMNYIDFAYKSNGKASVLMHEYTSEDNLDDLIKHKASMFMTDAWYEPRGFQNPGTFGSIPRIIQIIREKKLISKEETIYKLTGASRNKMGIKDRGLLIKGLAADITIIDWDNVEFNIVTACKIEEPKGIEHVFINGGHVLENGKLLNEATFGIPLKL